MRASHQESCGVCHQVVCGCPKKPEAGEAKHTCGGFAPAYDCLGCFPPPNHEEALEIAQRYIDCAFQNEGRERPRHSIPARPDYDDDLRLTAYIRHQRDCFVPAASIAAAEAELVSVKRERSDLRSELGDIEHLLEKERRYHEETKGYRQHAEQQLASERAGREQAEAILRKRCPSCLGIERCYPDCAFTLAPPSEGPASPMAEGELNSFECVAQWRLCVCPLCTLVASERRVAELLAAGDHLFLATLNVDPDAQLASARRQWKDTRRSQPTPTWEAKDELAALRALADELVSYCEDSGWSALAREIRLRRRWAAGKATR